jgi:hypothetical protein
MLSHFNRAVVLFEDAPYVPTKLSLTAKQKTIFQAFETVRTSVTP